MGGLGFPQHTLEILQKISKFYHNPEKSRTFFCNPRATELCMQTFPLLHKALSHDLRQSYRLSAPELPSSSRLEATDV